MSYILEKTNIPKLIEILQVKGYDVYVPVEKEKEFVFEKVNPSDSLALNYPTRTILPPKKFLYPGIEELFRVEKGRIKENSKVKKMAFLGLHLCDVHGIRLLEIALAHDPYYQAKRKDLFIIGITCQPDEFCFCEILGSNIHSGYDLFLENTGKDYIVFTGSKKGEILTKEKIFKETKKDLEPHPIHNQKIDFDRNFIEKAVKKAPDSVWQTVSERCFGCANCTLVCPVCFCFDIDDEIGLSGLKEVRRCRFWDSCQLTNFNLVAGGFNFRQDKWQRFKQRFTHKFVHAKRDFDQFLCTGCGRCFVYCPTKISLQNILIFLVQKEMYSHKLELKKDKRCRK